MTDAIDVNELYLKQKIKPRRVDSRKGDNGSVLIVGGNTIYHGAPILASIAALRTGADLVYVGVPRSIIDPVRSTSPCII
ncbi:MAG: NAD(P)H-hydrate dehydratase, partial [Nitrososphaeraceae archaeon]